jgi:Mg-chelatase subunit ChlD
LTSRAGLNNVLLNRFGSIPDKIVSINAVSNDVPFRIEGFIDPDGSPPTVIADGTSIFTLQFILYDRFGNPTKDQPVNITTSSGEFTPDRVTSFNGDVWYTYGPKSFTGLHNITATAVNNKSVFTFKEARFYNSTPSNLGLLANPASIPSRDANPAIYSEISAKVVDIVGNPVAGEDVSFTLHNINYDPSDTGFSTLPSFDSTYTRENITATTDANGLAIVRFYPSSLATFGQPGYKQSATGTAKVTATWNGNERDVDIIWKNYPYLSAQMVITPSQVKVGDTVDVHLKLNGDGWALTSKPIDVVLATDRSGSMAGTKMTDAKAAATLFANNLSVQDNVGLVSFGGSTATSDLGLTNNKPTITAKIATYGASGNTPMRDAVFNSANMIKTTGRDPATTVRAIILLTDGEWNTAGDPQGIITSPNTILSEPDSVGTSSVITYAKTNNMKLYIIGLGVSSGYRTILESYVTEVGGKYYNAPSSAELAGIYADIAGELRESAGVDTTATMDFGSITVNDALDITGNVFNYVADPETDGISTGPPVMALPYTPNLGSTMVRKYNKTHELIPGPGYTQVGPLYDNMTPYWNSKSPHELKFNIGEVKLNETWETNFRLRVLKEGSISLMGPGSSIDFKDVNGNTASMDLNNLSTFTSTQNAVITGATWKTITIEEFHRTDTNPEGALKTIVPITWTTNYNGVNPITHDVYFQREMDPEVRFDRKTTFGGGKSTLYSQLDLSSLQPGGYTFIIHAYSTDAEATEDIGPYAYNSQTRAFIKLE